MGQLNRYATRLTARLVPRIGAAWPSIAAIALSVVLANSGIEHLRPTAALGDYYQHALGDSEWTRVVGFMQLALSIGLALRWTRVTAAVVLAGCVLFAALNQWRIGSLEGSGMSYLLVFGWSFLVGWGERCRR